MTDDNHDQDPSVEDPSDADDLLYSTSYGTREFHSGPRGKDIIIGIILEETEDSFLVAMPTYIVENQQNQSFVLEELSMDEPFTRLMKHSFSYVSYPSVDHDMAYIDFLIKHSADVFPELLEMIGEDEGFTPKEEDGITEIPQQPAPATTVAVPNVGTLVNGNFTQEELKKKIDDAISKGGLFASGSTLAN